MYTASRYSYRLLHSNTRLKMDSSKRPTLLAVLNWEATIIPRAFATTFAISEAEALDIFSDLKCLMWLLNEMNFDGTRAQGKVFYIDDSLLILDEMWHTFILHTKQYFHFCHTLFGEYIHHDPTDSFDAKERKAELSQMPHAEMIEHVISEKRWQYQYVFAKLGKARFEKWYGDFHRKYSAITLLQMRNLAFSGDDITQPILKNEKIA